MIQIQSYQPADQEEVIALVLHCQNDGTRPIVSVQDQPELLHIPQEYLLSGGGFWVAKEQGKVIGCIGLMNRGGGIGILKKFFVYEAYRGKPVHLGKALYAELLQFATAHHFQTILLDTPKNTDRAHRFYEKAGFTPIQPCDLPFSYDHPYKDSDFFRLNLPS